jgi:hypothetical protein
MGDSDLHLMKRTRRWYWIAEADEREFCHEGHNDAGDASVDTLCRLSEI